jgi:hypothetical protein
MMGSWLCRIVRARRPGYSIEPSSKGEEIMSIHKVAGAVLVLTSLVVLTAAEASAQSSKAAWRFEEIVALDHAVADTDDPGPNGTG